MNTDTCNNATEQSISLARDFEVLKLYLPNFGEEGNGVSWLWAIFIACLGPFPMRSWSLTNS